MFNIGFGELVVLLLIAFVVVGPKDLPKVARWLGKGVRQLQGLASDMKDSMLPKEEAEALNELKTTVSEAKQSVEQYNPMEVVKREVSSLNPLADVSKDAQAIKTELKSVTEFNINH